MMLKSKFYILLFTITVLHVGVLVAAQRPWRVPRAIGVPNFSPEAQQAIKDMMTN